MNFLQKIFPIILWLTNYRRSYLNHDLFAGLTVGVMLIPQGMAYALIAGLPSVYGLYAAIVPQIIYAIFGTSRQLSVGPVAMDSLLVATGISLMAIEGTGAYIGLVILLALFIGVFQLLLGILRLGFITNLLSKPVISGFTSAVALVIAFNQLKYFLGIDVEKSSRFYEVVINAATRLDEVHWLTLLISVSGVVVIVGVKRIYKNVPGSLVAVLMGIGVAHYLRLDKLGVRIVGVIPDGLPEFKVPDLSVEHLTGIVPLAMTIGVIGFIEAFSIAKSIEARKRDYRVNPNKELVALGFSNLIGSFFQSFPVTAGFSRTAVNEQSGARTPLASIISALLIGVVLLSLTPVFYFLPEAILASVILVGVWGLIDWKYPKRLWHDSKIEFWLLVVTFLITLNINMIYGIVSGIVFSILILLYKAAYPHIARLGRVKGHHEFRNVKRFKDLEIWDNLMILRIDASLTFINIQYFRDYVESAVRQSPDIKSIILDAGPISYLDASAAQGLKELLESLNEKEIKFIICDVIGPVRDTIHRTELIDVINKENIFFDINEAVRFVTAHHKSRFEDYALQSNLRT